MILNETFFMSLMTLSYEYSSGLAGQLLSHSLPLPLSFKLSLSLSVSTSRSFSLSPSMSFYSSLSLFSPILCLYTADLVFKPDRVVMVERGGKICHPISIYNFQHTLYVFIFLTLESRKHFLSNKHTTLSISLPPSTPLSLFFSHFCLSYSLPISFFLSLLISRV